MDINDFVALLGLIFLTVGLWWVYPPSALIAGGTLLILAGTTRARAAATTLKKPDQNPTNPKNPR